MSDVLCKKIHDLLDAAELAELGPGPRPETQTAGALNARLDEILRDSTVSKENSKLIRALVLLWHDQHEVAHVIAQEIENQNGAFVHGIVHRREPDFSNAAYWFRRVGKHPAYGEIAIRVKALLDSTPMAAIQQTVLPKGAWDPMAFIRLCENASHGRSATEETRLLRQIQGIETAALIDHLCAKVA